MSWQNFDPENPPHRLQWWWIPRQTLDAPMKPYEAEIGTVEQISDTVWVFKPSIGLGVIKTATQAREWLYQPIIQPEPPQP